ncbi:MAG: tetratricopeptide (TPR) repeat protein [Saprospiraceae bacterium]|jgi:tetratricopeptide (TPR) repeat protein
MERLQQLQQFLEQMPNDSFVKFALAKEYEQLNDAEKALHYYNDIRTKDPDYVGTYYHLGKLQEALKDIEGALKTYKEGIEIAQKIGDKHAWSELAEAKLEIDD